MASINSHRKRQLYDQNVYRGGTTASSRAAPAAAFTMMPSKQVRGEEYYAYRRTFADLHDKLQRTYTGNVLRRTMTRTPGTTNYTSSDKIFTSPGGMGNQYDDDNHLRFYFRQYNNMSPNGPPIVYSSEHSAAAWLLTYSRSNTGLMNNGHHSHKTLRMNGSSSYYRVMSLSDRIGGNIKSRHSVLKWIGGMWREKA